MPAAKTFGDLSEILSGEINRQVKNAVQEAMAKASVSNPQMEQELMSALENVVADTCSDIVSKYELAPSQSSPAVVRLLKLDAFFARMKNASKDQMRSVVIDMYRGKRLQPALTMEALERQALEFFETMIAVMTGSSVALVRETLEGTNDLASRMLFEKAGFKAGDMDRLQPLLRHAYQHPLQVRA